MPKEKSLTKIYEKMQLHLKAIQVLLKEHYRAVLKDDEDKHYEKAYHQTEEAWRSLWKRVESLQYWALYIRVLQDPDTYKVLPWTATDDKKLHALVKASKDLTNQSPKSVFDQVKSEIIRREESEPPSRGILVWDRYGTSGDYIIRQFANYKRKKLGL